eukprot:TRINITY_DN6283_c0_g2_i2.p3 TRINITY_DN6283_c0_g2~~TRINITY_DN6283_c0_g2_i2.p3  ORF type:complete len:105 (-),score=19.64 TRINITY_DN6283_c0_g2_i2:62-376(-)
MCIRDRSTWVQNSQVKTKECQLIVTNEKSSVSKGLIITKNPGHEDDDKDKDNKKGNGGNSWWIILLVIIGVGIIGAGAYYLYLWRKRTQEENMSYLLTLSLIHI